MIQKGFYSKLMKEVEEGQTSEQEGESSEENISVFLEMMASIVHNRKNCVFRDYDM